ncbi:hypothetical protein [Paenibacillus thiaminolyticus]|uniref:Uncharacterized protein n=1 Tax=Paenibacillus thiaminolyticus TaxID=49283 RepID=A0A3A3GXG7_PANTH|nr:hypothetical protein [Paenibacillus thiaminolyticus]RJG22777.1 hypothetical protein DQX05_16200 [Paenibacillus thiaminolyticus]
MKKVLRNSLAAFLVLAFTVVLFTPQTSFAKASENFEFKIHEEGYAENSKGRKFKITFDKPAKNVHFGAVLDDAYRVKFPERVKFRLETKDGKTVFQYKTLIFSEIGDRDYTTKYTKNIDPGTYHVYIEQETYGKTSVEGNGFVYYDYVK